MNFYVILNLFSFTASSPDKSSTKALGKFLRLVAHLRVVQFHFQGVLIQEDKVAGSNGR